MIFKYVIVSTENYTSKLYVINAETEDEAINKLSKFVFPFMDDTECEKFSLADLDTILTELNYNIFSITKESNVN